MYRLYNGDCLEIMPTLEAGSIDAIITDLPYGTTACKWDTIIPFEPMWREVKRVLKPNGVFVTTASQPFTSALVMSNPKWFKYEWIWDKRKSSGALNAGVAPLKTHENIIVFCRGTSIYNKQMRQGKPRTDKASFIPNGDIRQDKRSVYRQYKNESGLYNPVSILEVSNANQRDKIQPTQKPIKLYEYLIRTYTNECETVLDITMGSGTTIVAAELTGRNSIGIEKDPDIFKTAQDRILNMYNAPKKVKEIKSDNGLQIELV